MPGPIHPDLLKFKSKFIYTKKEGGGRKRGRVKNREREQGKGRENGRKGKRGRSRGAEVYIVFLYNSLNIRQQKYNYILYSGILNILIVIAYKKILNTHQLNSMLFYM